MRLMQFDFSDPAQVQVSKIRGHPNLNTINIIHDSLGEDGCVRFFGWLTTGVLDVTVNGVPQKLDTESAVGSSMPSTTHRCPRSFPSVKMSDVRMGDTGLRALIDWLAALREHEHEPTFYPLRNLDIHANRITGDSQLATGFISSAPHLTSLNLSSNSFSPAFRRTLISLLPELRSLKMLHLSLTGLTTRDARALAKYIRAGGCTLVELHASANRMGYEGVKALVRALKRCWRLEVMNVFANDANQGDQEEDEDGDEDNGEDEESDEDGEAEEEESELGDTPTGWNVLQRKIKDLLDRNAVFKRQTAREALVLLRYSRILLQPSPSHSSDLPSFSSNSSCADAGCSPSPSHSLSPSPSSLSQTGSLPDSQPSSQPQSSRSSASPFNALPTELQLTILSHLAPFLSTPQRLKIFAFATDRSTLPSLRLSLPPSRGSTALRRPAGSGAQETCVPDPGQRLSLSLPGGPPGGVNGDAGAKGKKFGSLLDLRNGPGAPSSIGTSASNPTNYRPGTSTHRTLALSCPDGQCMGEQTLSSKLLTLRQKWLEGVGCDVHDPVS